MPDGGVHQAIGKPVTCTRCARTWASARLSAAQIGFVALTTKANERAERPA